MQELSRILIAVLLAIFVASDLSVADEKPILKVIETATVFDARSMVAIAKLSPGDQVEVVKRFEDLEKEPWLEVISTKDASIRGYSRASKFAPVKERPTSEGEDQAEPRQMMLPRNPGEATDLGLRLLRTATENQLNPAVSPYGIWSNTRFWLRAATGETRSSLEKQLGLHSDDDDGLSVPRIPGFRSVDRLLRSPKVRIKPSYLETVSRWNLSVLESVFDEPARVELNAWIKKWSMDRIPEFYSKEQWNPDAQLIFVNVACLDAEWEKKFEESSTYEGQFHTSNKESVPAAMMIQESRLRWFSSEKLDATGVILPYKQTDLAAVVFVPKTIDGISRFMERLNSRELDEVLITAIDEDVLLILPRFEVEGSLNLFAQLELTDVLPANPDFSEMTDADVTISEFRQKVQLTVDEDGTRAAAVTSTTIDTSSIRDTEPKLVEADRPFLLLVMHLPSRATLFAAQINQPKAPPKGTSGR